MKKEKGKQLAECFPLAVAGAALTGAILLTTINALGRYLFSRTFPWADEIVAICFAWTVFFGAAAAELRQMHYGLEIVANLLPPGGKKGLDLLISALSTVMIGCLAWLAWVLTAKVGTKIMTATRISYRYFDSGMAIGLSLMELYALTLLIGKIRAVLRKDRKEENR